jgi:hypothetical protein
VHSPSSESIKTTDKSHYFETLFPFPVWRTGNVFLFSSPLLPTLSCYILKSFLNFHLVRLLVVKHLEMLFDRTIMLLFCESAKMAAPPLNKFWHSKTAPPLPETTAHVLTSLPFPFYKSHCLPRLGAAPSFPRPAWQFGPAIKLCSMDMNFLVSFL